MLRLGDFLMQAFWLLGYWVVVDTGALVYMGLLSGVHMAFGMLGRWRMGVSRWVLLPYQWDDMSQNERAIVSWEVDELELADEWSILYTTADIRSGHRKYMKQNTLLALLL